MHGLIAPKGDPLKPKSSEDVDVYAITLLAGETMILDIDYGADNSVDTMLFVMNASGQLVAMPNDDEQSSMGGAGSPPNNANDAFITFRAPADGTYYAAVTSADNSVVFDAFRRTDGTFDGNGNTSGEYVLNISVRPPTADPNPDFDPETDLGGVLILADALLANDSFSDADAPVIIGVSNFVNGDAVLTADGDVIFRPTDPESVGSFDYTISDGQGGPESTATATVSMSGGDTTNIGDPPPSAEIIGSPSDDVLVSSAGNDVFTGGDGIDAFVFTPGSGADTISDGQGGNDFIIGSDTLILADGMSVADLVGQGLDTLVNFNTGDSVLLVGVSVTDIADVSVLLG